MVKTVTRADLVESIYQEVGLPRHECSLLVEQILEEISTSLISGNQVKIASFGSFSLRNKQERVGRNPRTGETTMITPRRVLSFRASYILKKKINQCFVNKHE